MRKVKEKKKKKRRKKEEKNLFQSEAHRFLFCRRVKGERREERERERDLEGKE